VSQIPQILSVAKGKYLTAKVALQNNTNQEGKKTTLDPRCGVICFCDIT
jgi:hypothetical protein